MSPAASELSTRSWTSRSMRFAPEGAEHVDLVPRQVGLLEDPVPHRVVDVVVDVRHPVDDAHDLALEHRRLALARVGEDPVHDLVRQVEPLARASGLLVVTEAARGAARRAPASPAWPNGGCPMSWPRPIASVRSSFSRSARATTRAIPVVSRVWVMRVR